MTQSGETTRPVAATGTADALVRLSHLDALESEAIHIMREVAAELERPVLLFSGGKDSIVLLRLAEKAFRPGRFPFPLMHVDTGPQLPRGDRVPRPPRGRARRAARSSHRVQESIDTGRVVEQTGPRASRNRLQTTTLLDAIDRARLRRRDRRRAPRRGALARERADLLLPRRLRPVGSAARSGPSSGTSTTADPQGRAGAGLPDLQLDRARRVAVRRARAARASGDLLRARAGGVRARRDALRRLRVHRALPARGAVRRVACASAPSAT